MPATLQKSSQSLQRSRLGSLRVHRYRTNDTSSHEYLIHTVENKRAKPAVLKFFYLQNLLRTELLAVSEFVSLTQKLWDKIVIILAEMVSDLVAHGAAGHGFFASSGQSAMQLGLAWEGEARG